MPDAPRVSVGIPTRDRPHLVREAIQAVHAQTYVGPVEIVVVFDGTDPDDSLAELSRVRVMRNERRPGLAGARNTAILAADNADLVAFCDDDDVWLPGKLAAQVAALQAEPDAEVCTCSISVDYRGKQTPRLAGTASVTHRQLLRSRMAMLHSSTFLARRGAMLDGLGLVDEEIPSAQNEDWDLLLRAARRHPVRHVDEPLVRVVWGASSHFSRQWPSKIAGLEWMLEHHPEIEQDDIGASRVYGQLAFAEACVGNRAAARRQAWRALSRHKRQWRALVAYAVATGFVSGERVLDALHRFGRGV